MTQGQISPFAPPVPAIGIPGATGPTGATGPIGPNAFTTLTAPFTVPSPGNSAIANVVNNTWIASGQYVVASDGTHVATLLAVPVNASTTQVTLTNPLQNVGNSGTPTIASAGQVSAGSGAYTPTTNTTQNFTVPAAGGTATVNVANAQFLQPGFWLSLGDGTNAATLKIQSVNVLAGTASLLNAANFSGNAIPNTVINSGALALVTAQPGGAISQSTIGTVIYANDGSPQGNIQPLTTLVLYSVPLPALALGEVLAISMMCAFKSTTTSDFGHVEQRLVLRNNGGTLSDPGGLLVGTDVTSPAWPQNTGTGSAYGGQLSAMGQPGSGNVQLQIVGGAIQVIVHNTSATLTVQAIVSVGYDRDNAATVGAGPAPVVSSISPTSYSAGGTTSGQIIGSHFTGVTGTGARVVLGGSGPNGLTNGVDASFAVQDDQHINITAAQNPNGAVTNGAVVVIHPLNGSSNTNITMSYTDDPNAMFFISGKYFAGAVAPGFWLRGDSIVTSSGNFASWTDKSPNGNNFSKGAGATGLTVTNNSAIWTPATWSDVTFNGTNDFISATIAPGTADLGLFLWAVYKLLVAPGAQKYLVSFGTASFNALVNTVVGSGSPAMFSQGTFADWGTSQGTTAGAGVWGFSDAHSVGASGVSQISLNGGNAVQVPATQNAKPSSSTMSIGAANSSAFINVQLVEAGGVFLPAGTHLTTEATRLHTYWHSTFGIP